MCIRTVPKCQHPKIHTIRTANKCSCFFSPLHPFYGRSLVPNSHLCKLCINTQQQPASVRDCQQQQEDIVVERMGLPLLYVLAWEIGRDTKWMSNGTWWRWIWLIRDAWLWLWWWEDIGYYHKFEGVKWYDDDRARESSSKLGVIVVTLLHAALIAAAQKSECNNRQCSYNYTYTIRMT